MVDLRTGRGAGAAQNASADNLVRGKRFGIGNVRTLTGASGSESGLYRAHALKEGMLGGIRSTDNTIVALGEDGAWRMVYNYQLQDDGSALVVPVPSDGSGCYLEIL